MENKNPSGNEKIYTIGGKEYKLREKYSLKDWGKIIKIMSGMDMTDAINSLSLLLADDKTNKLLEIIFGEPVPEDIYEEDFQQVSGAITDFFSRKKSLMKNMQASSAS